MSFLDRRSRLFSLTFAALLVSACSSSSTPPAAGSTVDGGTGPSDTASALQNIVDTAVAAGTFTKLTAAVTAAGLATTLSGPGPFTVFAPTDDAFAKLPAGTLDTLLLPANQAELQSILKFHVLAGEEKAADVTKLFVAKTLEGKDVKIAVSGGAVTLTDGQGNVSKITQTDILASNGVIHVIDTVLLPPAPTKDIVDTAAAAGTFTKLAAALTAADLVTTLKGPGPFTVFAPTDTAFANLPAGTLDSLLEPANQAELQGVLKYHVVSGAEEASDVSQETSVTTLNGSVSVAATSTGITLNGTVHVISYDIEATNGVIHVIDAVLLPKM